MTRDELQSKICDLITDVTIDPSSESIIATTKEIMNLIDEKETNMKKRTISARTRTGITKLQALKQMKKAAFVFKKEVAKILEDNDLFYCVDTDIKNRVSKTNRCADDMVYALLSEKSIVHAMIKCDLKTRKEALEFGYY